MALADDVVNVAHTAAAKANALTAHRTPPTRVNRLCAVTPHLSDLDMTTSLCGWLRDVVGRYHGELRPAAVTLAVSNVQPHVRPFHGISVRISLKRAHDRCPSALTI